MNIAYSLGHISITQIDGIDWLVFNVKFGSISAISYIANQPLDVRNNQFNGGLISIRNVKEKIIKRVRKWLLAKYWYAVSVCSLLQYIFKEYDIQVHKELCYGELNVITRVRLNIAKHIYNIVVHICMYFSYCLLKHLNICDVF